MICCWLWSIVYCCLRANSVGTWSWKSLCLTSLSVKSLHCRPEELKSLWDLFNFEGCRSLRIEICTWAWSHTIIFFLIIIFILVVKFRSWTRWISWFHTVSCFTFAKLCAMSCCHFWVSHFSSLTVHFWGENWGLFVFIYRDYFLIISYVMAWSWSFNGWRSYRGSWISCAHWC